MRSLLRKHWYGVGLAAVILSWPLIPGPSQSEEMSFEGINLDALIDATHDSLPVDYPEELYLALTQRNYEVFEVVMDYDLPALLENGEITIASFE